MYTSSYQYEGYATHGIRRKSQSRNLLKQFLFRVFYWKVERNSITRDQVELGWSRAAQIMNLDADKFRMDLEGRLMKFDKYGDKKSKWGWRIIISLKEAAGKKEKSIYFVAMNYRSNIKKI